MTEITFHPSGQTISIPSSWDEMTPEQVRFVFKTYDRCIRTGASPLEFNIRVLYFLLGIKSLKKYVKLSIRKPSAARKISENTLWLCHSCLDFLLKEEESGEVPRLSYNSIRNSLPAVRSNLGPLLTGPADLLQDLTFGEFRHAFAALSAFFESHDEADLNECIAHLYRPVSRTANRAGRKVQPVSQATFEKDVKAVSKLPSWQKNMIMMFFSNCVNYLQKESVVIDGETISFSSLYSGDSGGSGMKFGWNDLLVQLSRDNVIGNIDRVEEEPLFRIFSIMWTNYKENKKNESNSKKTS